MREKQRCRARNAPGFFYGKSHVLSEKTSLLIQSLYDERQMIANIQDRLRLSDSLTDAETVEELHNSSVRRVSLASTQENIETADAYK